MYCIRYEIKKKNKGIMECKIHFSREKSIHCCCSSPVGKFLLKTLSETIACVTEGTDYLPLLSTSLL